MSSRSPALRRPWFLGALLAPVLLSCGGGAAGTGEAPANPLKVDSPAAGAVNVRYYLSAAQPSVELEGHIPVSRTCWGIRWDGYEYGGYDVTCRGCTGNSIAATTSADLWLGTNHWRALVPVCQGLNRISIWMVDCTGALVATASLELTPEPLAFMDDPGTGTWWGIPPYWESLPGCPFSGMAQDSRAQFVLLASELAQAGIPAGASLKDLHLHAGYRMAGDHVVVRNFRIRLQHSTAATTTGFVADGWTTVYSITSQVPGDGTWEAYPFSQPFVWNGRDHLLVDLTRDDATTQAALGEMQLRTGLPSRMVVGWGDSVAAWPFDTGLATAVLGAVPAVRIGWTAP